MRARVGGYVVDMVILAAIAMLMGVIAGAILLLVTNGAKNDPTDAETYMFLAIIGLGTPAVWSLLNLVLLWTRGQTGGQYVAGVRLAREDAAALTKSQVPLWWFCVNPLLFSWPMAVIACLPLAAVVAIALSRGTIVVFGVVLTLCLVAPLIALVSALFDGQNRTLHDRIAGTVVIPAA